MVLDIYNISNLQIGLYIFIGAFIVLVIVIISIIISKMNKKKNLKVMNSSEYIKGIKELNEKYTFEKLSSTSMKKVFVLKSKKAFDSFSYIKKREEYIKNNLSYYLKITEQINHNISTYSKYKIELANIKKTTDPLIASTNKMSLKSFNKREDKIAKGLIKHPQTNFSLLIRWEYTSPAGRNHYYNSRTSSFNDILRIVNQLSNTSNSFMSNTYYQNVDKPINLQVDEKVYTNDDIEDLSD